MKLRNKHGWPVTSFTGRQVVNFIRYLLHTNIRQTWRLRNFVPNNTATHPTSGVTMEDIQK